MVTAADLMTRRVLSVKPETPIGEVAKLILEKKITSLPVVNEEGKLVGIVGEGDLIRCGKRQQEPNRSWWLRLMTGTAANPDDIVSQSRRRVEEVMSKDVLLASEDENLANLVELLSRQRIKRLPIVKGGKLVGIVSRVDVLRHLAANRLLRQDQSQVAA